MMWMHLYCFVEPSQVGSNSQKSHSNRTQATIALHCVCTLICMTMRMIQWVVNGIAMPLNVIWFFLYMRFHFPRYRCKLYGYLHCLQALKLPKFSSSFQQHPFEVFLLETLIFFSKGNQLIGTIRRIHFVLKKLNLLSQYMKWQAY